MIEAGESLGFENTHHAFIETLHGDATIIHRFFDGIESGRYVLAEQQDIITCQECFHLQFTRIEVSCHTLHVEGIAEYQSPEIQTVAKQVSSHFSRK